MDLEEYDFDIIYIKGKENVVADALSRISIRDFFQLYEEGNILAINSHITSGEQKGQKTSKIRTTNRILAITRSMTNKNNSNRNINFEDNLNITTDKIKVFEDFTVNRKKTAKIRLTNMNINNGKIAMIEFKIYKNHETICSLILNQDNEILTLKSILSRIENLANEHGIHELEWPSYDRIFEISTMQDFKIIANNTLKNLQVYLTKSPLRIFNDEEKLQIIEKFHNDQLYGHCGQKKLYAKIRDVYYWRNMTRDIARYINSCEICKLTKPGRKTVEKLVLTKTPCKPFQLVQIDTIGPLPKSDSGNVYAVTIIDEMSKWLNIIPVPNKSAIEVAKAIFEKHILIYGPMVEIKSDLGLEYKNELVRELCKLLNIKQTLSTAYHHETLGLIERSHRILNEYIRAYLNGKLDHWDKFAHYFQFFYNISKNSSLGDKYSPFEIVFMKKCILPNI